MLVQKGHCIQLLPNNEQHTIFVQWAGAHRWAYNWGLERKVQAFRETGESPSTYVMMKEIVALKRTEEYAWLQGVSKSIPRMALLHLETAYANYFREKKDGTVAQRIAKLEAEGKWEARCEKLRKKGLYGFQLEPGFPNFKSRKRSKMVFHLEPDQIRIEGKRIRLPKIGWIRMTKPLRFEGKLIGTVAISERAGKWYASVQVETEHIPTEKQDGIVGIDLGVKTLATLSDGTQFGNPKALKHYQCLLARAQHQLDRKQKGSNRWKKAKLRVQRIHKCIADIRANATHHATRYIADTYSFVAMESLNTSGMMQNHKLAGAVADANFCEFKRQVAYKVAWEDGELALVDQWFPSSRLCSGCGCINSDLTLADRVWTCECGAVHDRDVNAAKNILAKALHDRGLPVAGRGGKGQQPPYEASREQRKCKSLIREVTRTQICQSQFGTV